VFTEGFVSSGETFYEMFRDSSFNTNISGWNVSSGTDFIFMFDSALTFDENLDSWPDIAKNAFNFVLMNQCVLITRASTALPVLLNL